MIVIDKNDRPVWATKDQDGNFAKANSIKKTGKHEFLYIGFRTFSQECRVNTGKEQAEKALLALNNANTIADFNMTFHLEWLNLDKIIKEHKLFKGDNMVIIEKNTVLKFPKPLSRILTKAI